MTKRLDELKLMLVGLAALGLGCGGGDVQPRPEDGGPDATATPRIDAGRARQPAQADAGLTGSLPSDAGTIMVPAPPKPTPETARSAPPRTERLIGTLSSDELQRLCQDSRKEVARTITLQAEMKCTAAAIALTRDPEQCNAERAACMGQAPASPLSEDTCVVDAPAIAEDCADVSVTDMRACFEAWAKLLEVASKQIDCSMAGTPRDTPPLPDPEECQNIDARCTH